MINLKIFYFLILLITLFQFSCVENPTEPLRFGNIKGEVWDSENGVKLEYVQITTTPKTKSVVTDGLGAYEISSVKLGNYYVFAVKYGYKPDSMYVNVYRGRTFIVNFNLFKSN